MHTSSVPSLRILWLVAGFTVWAAAFVALYAMLSVGCRFGWESVALPGGVSLQRAMLVALFLLSLGANALVVWLAAGRRRELHPQMHPAERLLVNAGWLAGLAALGATAVSLGPVFFLSPCM